MASFCGWTFRGDFYADCRRTPRAGLSFRRRGIPGPGR